jgi:diacylglycerol kinase (ATP)
MRARRFVDSLRYAVDGLVYALRTQRNIRIHFVTATAIIASAMFLGITRSELVALFLTIMVVILAEMVNTAIEAAVDLVTGTYHPLARIAKNVAAGAVLVTAIGACFIGFYIFADDLSNLVHLLLSKTTHVPLNMLGLSLVLILIVTLTAKAVFPLNKALGRATPSGMTALAFSVSTWVCLRTEDDTSSLFVLFLAIIVGYSRIEAQKRTLIEVLSGAIIGVILSLFTYKFSIDVYH